MLHHRRLLAVALGLAGCGTETVDQFLPAPPVSAARSVLIFVRDEGGGQAVLAADVGPGWSQSIELAEEVAGLFALEYDCPLAALGIEPGPVLLAAAGTGRAAPAPDRVWSLEVGASFRWEPVVLPLELAELELEIDEPPCASFEVTLVEVPRAHARESRALVVVDDESVLVANDDDIVRRVYLDGRVEPLDPALAPMGSHIFAAKRGDDGLVTWVTEAGCLYRGAPLTPLALLGCLTLPFDEEWVFVLPPELGGPDETYVLGDGRLIRWDGGETVLVETDDQPSSKTGLTRVGPGDVIVAGLSYGAIYRDTRGRFTTQQIMTEMGVDKIINVTSSKKLGAMLGTNLGYIYREESPEHWVRMPGQAAAVLRNMLPFDQGLIAGGHAGFVTEMRQDGGVCTPLQPVDMDMRRLEPFGRGLVAVGDDADNDLSLVAFMIRGDQRPACGSR